MPRPGWTRTLEGVGTGEEDDMVERDDLEDMGPSTIWLSSSLEAA
jgi:hypothetical protein